MIGEWFTPSMLKDFFIAAIGSLAGAWGGAWAIQRIAERAKTKEHLLKQIRLSNAAIELAQGIFSVYANLKLQHVREMKQVYDTQRALVHEVEEDYRKGKIPPGTPRPALTVPALTLDMLRVRPQPLERIVIEELDVKGRPRPAMAELIRSIETLNRSIEARNELIDRLKQPGMEQQAIALIFGLPLPSGGVDMTFGSVVEAIYTQTDDCIHFSRLICDDLHAYATRVREEYKSRFRAPYPSVHKVVYELVEQQGLIPPRDRYVSWDEGFLFRVEQTLGRRREKFVHGLTKTLRRLRRRLRLRDGDKTIEKSPSSGAY